MLLDQWGPSVASRDLGPANHGPAPPDCLTLYGGEVYFISTGRATLWTLRPCQHSTFNNTRSMHRELFLRFFNKADIRVSAALRCGQRPKTSWHHRKSAWASLPDHAMTMTRTTDQCNIMQCEVERSTARAEQLHCAVPYHPRSRPLAPSRVQCAYCPAPPISPGPGAVSVYTSYWGVVRWCQAPACV